MSAETELSPLQRWMQTFIVEPGDASAAVPAANRSAGWSDLKPEDLVLPSATMTPTERLEVYRDQYLLRMEEALEIDFPTVQSYLGRDRFFELVEEYVKVYPSRSYTLNHLGNRFVDFISEGAGGGSRPALRRRAMLTELARLEWTLCEIFDAEGEASVPIERLAELSLDDWANARLRPVNTFRMFDFAYPVHLLLQARNQSLPLPKIRPRPTRVVAWRWNELLRHEALDRPQSDLMDALLGGEALNPAMGAVLSRHRVAPQRLFNTLTVWIAEGMFGAINSPLEGGEGGGLIECAR